MARGAPVVPTIRMTSWGVARLSRRSSFRRWLQPDADFTRGLQPRVSDGGRRETWRLDFRALPSKTACTVAGDGCKQGLAVYSVRSYTDREEHIWFLLNSANIGTHSIGGVQSGCPLRARGLLRSVGWCAAGRDHVRAAGSFWARGARVHACLEGRLSHGTRLLRTTGRAPLPASSPVRFLASARSESATLDGPYNIRLHQTAPCGLGLYSGRAESLVVRYCGHPGSGVRNRFLERLVSIWSSRSDRNSSRPERTHGAAGEPEPLYGQKKHSNQGGIQRRFG